MSLKHIVISGIILITFMGILFTDTNKCMRVNTSPKQEINKSVNNPAYCNKDSSIAVNAPNLKLPGKSMVCRVTAANLRSKTNFQGKSLVGLLTKYGNICAVELGKIPMWSKITVNGKTYTAVDTMSRRSVKKHHRMRDIDACVDIYHNVPTRQLRRKDLGVKKVTVTK